MHALSFRITTYQLARVFIILSFISSTQPFSIIMLIFGVLHPNVIMRDAVLEDSENFFRLGFFEVNINSSTQAAGLEHFRLH